MSRFRAVPHVNASTVSSSHIQAPNLGCDHAWRHPNIIFLHIIYLTDNLQSSLQSGCSKDQNIIRLELTFRCDWFNHLQCLSHIMVINRSSTDTVLADKLNILCRPLIPYHFCMLDEIIHYDWWDLVILFGATKVKSLTYLTSMAKLIVAQWCHCCHRTRSTLVRVMDFCLMETSHYLNQCWYSISKVRWHSSGGNLTRDA